MTISYLWISSHFLAISFILRRQKRLFFEILIAIIITCVYLWKPPTYDLIGYLDYFSNPYPYEIGFWKATEFLIQHLHFKPSEILLFWQFVVFLITFSSFQKISQKNYLLSIVVICLSLSFFLSTQNALRQGIAFSILIFGLIDACIKKISVNFFVYAAISTLFHHSTPLFAIILTLFFLSNNLLTKKHRTLTPTAGLILGFTFLAILKISFTDSIYLDQSIDWGAERTSSWVKYIIIALAFTISQYTATGHLITRNNIFFKLREFYFFFLFPIAFLPEIFARLALLYFFIESILIFYMLSFPTQKFRLSSIFLICTYGLAPNALNIILGGANS